MIKKLLALSTVLAGAALLQNKERRERLTQQAQSFIKGAREKLSQVQGQVTDQSADRFGSSTGAGATSRAGMSGHVTPPVTTPRNGIY